MIKEGQTVAVRRPATLGRTVALRRHATLGRYVSLGLALGLVFAAAACSSPPAAAPGAPTTSVAESTTSTSTSSPATSTARSTTSTAPSSTTTAADPTAQLPGDLTPNVVEDECLLTAAELGTLVGRVGLRAENTEVAGGSTRRSCFYAPETADDPVARIDVYGSVTLPPAELVARIAANGGRAIAGIGQGAVVVTGQGGTTELAVASASLLAVLTLLPGGAPAAPSDEAWSAAGTTMVGRLSR